MAISTFFTKWSPEMAYVLGFFAADGSMYVNPRGSKYVSFYCTDKDIIWKIKHLMEATQKISRQKRDLIRYPNWLTCYVLQMGSLKLYNRLLELGFTPNKSTSLKFPVVPNKFLKDFIRGYFDGDGFSCFSVFKRKDRSSIGKAMLSGFVCGSKSFLMHLKNSLEKSANIQNGTLYFYDRAFRLSYSAKNSAKLFNFMYNGVAPRLYLKRKRLEFEKNLSRYGVSVGS
ncbi:MAG: intein homing endonuclease-related protein [Candidatus Peregrinibacteria bacterium GW2011_GWF2_38_29]|nr:MAG: intein homing endonuclease-related protein [Candidatus Peregrinibacteria bacterium GW2011_GWF2_38_29]HBB03277.1 hypothetical protein [Candidatus Peregrinibacteria bacterium]